MKTRHFLLVGALFAAFATPAWAAVPELSGTYLVNIVTTCGIPADPWPNGVTSSFDGSFQVIIGQLTFYSTTHKATLTGYKTTTQLIVPNSHAGSTTEAAYSSGSVSYANTATTFTLNGEVFDIVYGKESSGVAVNLEFAGTSTEGTGVTKPNCVTHGTANQITS